MSSGAYSARQPTVGAAAYASATGRVGSSAFAVAAARLMYEACDGPGRALSSLPIDHTITDGWLRSATMLDSSTLTAASRT